ncbi:MAG: response regulator transcription factor [Alphaproteobacteria bacterium]|nr:response regulator transcription factor [Alphaproteobacteria bacterium]
MRILLVEDDDMLGTSLKKALERNAYGVDWVQDGEAAIDALTDLPFAAVVLDVNLPKCSGIEVLRAIRSRKNMTPVLLLTARDLPQQKVEGLDAGADDYLIKPFDLDELLARLRALIRRSAGRAESTIRCGAVVLEPAASLVRKGDAPVMMTAKEFRTLKLLMERAGKFVTKSDIEYVLYSAEDAAESNTVEVTIYNLRKKLGSAFIQTVRGVGYRVNAV